MIHMAKPVWASWLAGIALLASSLSTATAQDRAPLHRAVVGFASCIGCHGRNRTDAGNDDLPVPSPSGNWILDNELRTWANHDKHYQAYAVLFNARSVAMAKLMGSPAAHRDRRCLSCHTGYPAEQMKAVDGHLVAESWHTNTDVSYGITCEGCHGPGGDLAGPGGVKTGWFRLHLPPTKEKRPWRFLAPRVKWEEHGYVDVRTPSGKARLCGSCHIGDARQGRVVTHEMYAAGHPPLPGFEVATFSSQMPVHWRPVSAKPDTKPEKSRSEFLARTSDPYFAKERFRLDAMHRTQGMMVGALVSLAQSLEVTAALSGPGGQGGSWPELAQFECYACHHDLKVPAWRQKRLQRGRVPGRPVLREWTTVLARVAVGGDSQRAEFDRQWTQVRDVLDRTPFGKQADLNRATATMGAWLMKRAQELEAVSVDRAMARQLLQDIADAGAAGGLDYESARQLAWACDVIGKELGRGSAEELQTVRASGIVLVFPQRPVEPVGAGVFEARRGPSRTREMDLAKLLPPIGNYDPKAVTRAFKSLGTAVRKWPGSSSSTP